jgi:hypothetical protein
MASSISFSSSSSVVEELCWRRSSSSLGEGIRRRIWMTRGHRGYRKRHKYRVDGRRYRRDRMCVVTCNRGTSTVEMGAESFLKSRVRKPNVGEFLFTFFGGRGESIRFGEDGFNFNGIRVGVDENFDRIWVWFGGRNMDFRDGNGTRNRSMSGRGEDSRYRREMRVRLSRMAVVVVSVERRRIRGVLVRVVHAGRVIGNGGEGNIVGGTKGVTSRRRNRRAIDGRRVDLELKSRGIRRGSGVEGGGRGIESGGGRRGLVVDAGGLSRRGRRCGGVVRRRIDVECLGKSIEVGGESTRGDIWKAEESRCRDRGGMVVLLRRAGLGAGISEFVMNEVGRVGHDFKETRRDETRLDETRQGETRRDETRRDD